MSEATTSSLQEEILEGLTELLDAPTVTQVLDTEDEVLLPRRKPRRHRKGENQHPTPLQVQYQRQLRDNRQNMPELIESMSRMVAWTWMPGKDRRDCPPIVDLRDPRLVVMDRFPLESGRLATQIGLAMYRVSISKQGTATYAAPENVEMFKDFSIRPHFRAGGLCLDSRNEEVLRTALALDHAMELVARGKQEPVQTFVPPPVLCGFPKHYLPNPEWRVPMQEAVRRALHPTSSSLRCLLSPGGIVCGVLDTRDGFRTINVEREGNLINIRVPNWVILSEATKHGGVVLEGQPLADLPRGEFTCIKDITSCYPFRSLEWLERRLLDELTEMVNIEEDVFDRQTGTRTPKTTTWRCVPSQFVATQVGRVVRHFLDMRGHLGRLNRSCDLSERDVFNSNQHQVRADVLIFNTRPSVTNCVFSDTKPAGKGTTWNASLLAMPADAAWAARCPMRGVGAA